MYDEIELEKHFASLRAEGYEINRSEFQRLRSWHSVLYQLHSAEHSLEKLTIRKPSLGDLEDIHETQALFANFILQYSKCFTSSRSGKVSLDERKIFPTGGTDLIAHKRILEIRHSLIAHNGTSDLVKETIAVREEADRYLVRHLITFALPMNELPSFKDALVTVNKHVVLRLNKHLNSLQEKLGKLVHLGNEA